LRDAAAVFFTCEEEQRLARQSFRPYACRERVVAYGTASPRGDLEDQLAAWRAKAPTLTKRPFWLFLGRIHPKKGVDLLLHAYAAVAKAAPGPLPALVIAGPCSDPRYRASLDRIVATLPDRCQVIWPGMIDGEAKWGALRAAEAFVLPSHQENFGIAVAEALAVGTPVLISRQVNIWREIEAAHAGFAEADDLAGTTRLLERWLATPESERRAASEAAAGLFRERYEIGRVARSLADAIAPLVGSRLQPA
ncbi:MAG TPA: glycosyltransferase, partial [Opitutus sp.]|nr:glycosyltransferase [Opitutus sp.]